MQAPKEVPLDMQFKDKFLVQSTVVPYGASDEDIVPSFVSALCILIFTSESTCKFWFAYFFIQQFSKENGRYIQEDKLKVVLVKPPHFPVVEQSNGTSTHESAHGVHDSAEICISNNSALQHEPANEVPTLRENSVTNNIAVKLETIHENHTLKETHISSDQVPDGVANLSSSHVISMSSYNSFFVTFCSLYIFG